MSDFNDLQRIFEAQKPSPVWSRLDPELGPPLVGNDPELTLLLEGLEVAFVFNGEGQLLGAFNWKE